MNVEAKAALGESTKDSGEMSPDSLNEDDKMILIK